MTSATALAFVVDMNVSPEWVAAFRAINYDAQHWSTIGDPAADDSAIMAWAIANDRVVFTLDLDFGTALALTHASGPSVFQVRTDSSLPEVILPLVRTAVIQHGLALSIGALVVVDETKSRVRILPL